MSVRLLAKKKDWHKTIKHGDYLHTRVLIMKYIPKIQDQDLSDNWIGLCLKQKELPKRKTENYKKKNR